MEKLSNILNKVFSFPVRYKFEKNFLLQNNIKINEKTGDVPQPFPSVFCQILTKRPAIDFLTRYTSFSLCYSHFLQLSFSHYFHLQPGLVQFKCFLQSFIKAPVRSLRNNISRASNLSSFHFRFALKITFRRACSLQRECMRTATIGPDLRLSRVLLFFLSFPLGFKKHNAVSYYFQPTRQK